jgi:hypothetical protein
MDKLYTQEQIQTVFTYYKKNLKEWELHKFFLKPAAETEDTTATGHVWTILCKKQGMTRNIDDLAKEMRLKSVTQMYNEIVKKSRVTA